MIIRNVTEFVLHMALQEVNRHYPMPSDAVVKQWRMSTADPVHFKLIPADTVENVRFQNNNIKTTLRKNGLLNVSGILLRLHHARVGFPIPRKPKTERQVLVAETLNALTGAKRKTLPPCRWEGAPGALVKQGWRGRERILPIACWHVHGVFFDALPVTVTGKDGKEYPLQIVARGKVFTPDQDWRNDPDRDWNAGSQHCPIRASEQCHCDTVPDRDEINRVQVYRPVV